MYDVTLVLPSINPKEWQRLYYEIERNLGPIDSKHHLDIKWELIIISPFESNDEILNRPNVRFIQDYGNPTRCVQIASTVARGKLFTWMSDDVSIIENNLKRIIIDSFNTNPENYELVVRYYEIGTDGQYDDSARYWYTGAHGAVDKLRGLSRTQIIAPVGITPLSTFRTLGGFDCKFMHINMCCLDYSCRITNTGGRVILPDYTVYTCTWGVTDSQFLTDIFEKHDKLHFWSIYDDINIAKDRKTIDYTNWTEAPPIWKEKWGDKAKLS